MNKIVLSAALAAAAGSALYAAPEITISSTPALPTQNYILQSDFTDGKLTSWSANRAAPELVTADAAATALKITGNPEKSPNAYHRLRNAFKKGEPYYLKLRAKRSGSGEKAASGSLSLSFDPAAGGKPIYSRVPDMPKTDYNWAEFSISSEIPMDVKMGTLYLCFYKQQGEILFDDIVFKCGSTDLNISVKGGGLQMVTVRNSVIGTVLKENINAAEYNKTIKVPAFGSYAVEVLDRTGEVTSALYPANEDANVAASDTVVPVTPIKRIIVKPQSADNFTFILPQLNGKKAYLEFKARASSAKAGPAGNTQMLQIKLNSKALGTNNAVKPGKVLTMAGRPERKVNIANKNGFIVYFCNTFMDIDKKSPYLPLTYENNNPFDFKLDITRVAEADGLNMLDLQNTNPKADLIIEDLKVVIE
ncbi:MAG: hypothetical protein E7056_06865 [Lentisphaerae bacterium]|nr:hypothetical protein [Lentisphaerota bacterium]